MILFYFLVLSEKLDKLIYSVIIGGALGNFYDRLAYNAVPDFIDLHYENFHWFTFNVADIFITIGILVFILRSIFFLKIKYEKFDILHNFFTFISCASLDDAGKVLETKN